MAFDGNGNFVRIHSWQQDAANAIDINAAEMDGEDDGFAGGLSVCVTRDGQGRMSSDFLPNTDNLLNLGSSSARWASINGVPVGSIISGIYIATTPAEIAARVVPTVFTYFQGDPRRYGALYDGTTDATAAMVKACAVGGEIIISGPLVLASAALFALPNNALTLKSGTNVRFVNTGGATSGGSITITGSTGCNVFYSLNRTDIRILNPIATGIGGTGVTNTTGYFWYCKADATATAHMYRCRVRGGRLTNFAGLYWVYFDNVAGTTYRMIDCGMDGTEIVSQAGNCQGPASVTITACVCGFSGSDTVSYFGIVDCSVFNLKVYGSYIKEVVLWWSGVARGKAYNNFVVGCGTDASISNDCISYAFAAYDHSHGVSLFPDLIEIYDNEINGVRDCGIYGAVANRIYIRGNVINGQTSTANGTLPKGAIAVSGCTLAVLDNNEIDGCAFGVSVVVAAGNRAIANNTTITGQVTGTTAMYIQPGNLNGGTTVGSVSVDGLRVVGDGTSGCLGLRFDSSSTLALKNVSLKNLELDGCYNSLVQSSDGTVPALGNVVIDGVILRGYSNLGLSVQNCSNANTKITINNVEFQGPSSASQDMLLINSHNLNISNIRFRDRVSGTNQCWYGAGAQGTVTNVQFINVASARKVGNASDLGGALPTWTGNDNDFVQNLNPVESGVTVGSKYCVLGWVNDVSNAAWRDCRTLTGN